ncbi:MAG TPA: MBL fold metallo-hydrolase [Pyrinomonadaceae bacterium]|nr:MBL fold metallo-hydrolase [Pyrinomonadaceae bacterium]
MTKTKTPRDAAAIILLRQNEETSNTELFWVRRSIQLSFLGGYHAFAGGKLEKSDAEVSVANSDDAELSSLIVCAAREAFEEIGVLLARGGEKLTRGQRASLHDDLCSGRMTFGEILAHWGLWLDARDFEFAGAWITPPFSPVRFNTRFFLAVCPPKQEPYISSGELESGEWISPQNALQKWQKGEILCAPQILNTLRVFAETGNNSENRIQRLVSAAGAEGAHPRKIELNPRFTLFPLATETLPPATHTNCFIVGREKFVVIDAAARDENEQIALHEFIDSIIEAGGVCEEIIVSHLHSDHTGGELALQKHLLNKFNLKVPISAHRLTAEGLPEIRFDRFLEGGERLKLKDVKGENFELEILHLPGHTRGHLCFYDAEIGFLLSSDNVVGTGSVLIAPPEGNMKDYLYSLGRMHDLPNLRFLCGSHGAAQANAFEKIESYIAHRLEREQKILEAFNNGAKTPREIVERVYTDVKPELWHLAEKSIEAHLEKLRFDNLI